MFVVGLVLLCAALVSYILRHPQPTPIEPALRQVEQSRRATDSAVTVLTQARGETRGVSQREREAAARVRAQLKRTDDSLKALTEVLVDSAATMSDLRRSLSSAIQTADTLSDVVTHYVTMVDSLKSAYAIERRAATVAIERAEKTIVQQDSVIRVLRGPECHVLGRRCPSRTEMLLVGASAGLIAALLTIR